MKYIIFSACCIAFFACGQAEGSQDNILDRLPTELSTTHAAQVKFKFNDCNAEVGGVKFITFLEDVAGQTTSIITMEHGLLFTDKNMRYYTENDLNIIYDKYVQPLKALLPSISKLLGKTTLCSVVLLLNAFEAIS